MFVRVIKGQPTPITLTEFRKQHPQTSFPKEIPLEMLARYDLYPARDMDRPDTKPNEQATRSEDFTQVRGEWVREWNLQTLTQEEVRAGMVCTRLQGRLALGKTEIDRLDAFIDSLPNNWALRQVVDGAVTWHRLSQDMQLLGHALNYTDDEMDAAFVRAMAVLP